MLNLNEIIPNDSYCNVLFEPMLHIFKINRFFNDSEVVYELVSGICDGDLCGIEGNAMVALSCVEVGLKFGSWTASEYVGRLQTSLR